MATDTNSGLHISIGVNRKFLPRAKHAGAKNYTLLGKPCKYEHTAVRRLADAMIRQRFKRGDVLLYADYYDPIIIFEMVRK